MKEQKQSILKRYSGIIAISFLLILFISFFRNLTKSMQIQKRIENEEKKVEELKKENEELRAEREKVLSDVYIEKQIRDKLGLAKEGEYIVVLPEEEILRKLVPKQEEEKEILPDPNWKKWVNFFGF